MSADGGVLSVTVPVPADCCPRCRQPILDHFTLAATPEELENWNNSSVVCWLTRGDVQALIDSTATNA